MQKLVKREIGEGLDDQVGLAVTGFGTATQKSPAAFAA